MNKACCPTSPPSMIAGKGEEYASSSSVDDDEWDEFLASHPGSHHEQSSHYGRIREHYGFECDRVVVRSKDKIIGGVQIMVQATPVGRLALILRGPLAVADDPVIMARTVTRVDELARKRGYASIRVETFPTQLAAQRVLANAGFESSPVWFGERPSLIVPLAGSDEQLLAQMKPKGRYNTRLAIRNGVAIEVGDATSLEDFYQLHLLTATYKGFPLFPREYYQYLFNVFGARRGAQHFLAYHNGKPVAAIFNTIVDGRMYYCAGGLHRGSEESKLMANYLLHFQAMVWARQNGCSHYDLVGVTSFKKRIAHQLIHWPLAMRKYYGPARKLRRGLTALSWQNTGLRHIIKRAAFGLGLNRKLPW